MADGAARAHVGLLVQYGAVLNVGILSHSDGPFIPAEHGVVPHTDVFPQRDVPNNSGAGTDQNGFIKARFSEHGKSLFPFD